MAGVRPRGGFARDTNGRAALETELGAGEGTKLLEYCDVEGGSNRGESRPLWANLNGSHACVTTDAQQGVLSIREGRRRRAGPAGAGCSGGRGQGRPPRATGAKRSQPARTQCQRGCSAGGRNSRGGGERGGETWGVGAVGCGLGAAESVARRPTSRRGCAGVKPPPAQPRGDGLKLPGHAVRSIRATQAEGLRWAATGPEGLRLARPQALQRRSVGGGQRKKKGTGTKKICARTLTQR